MRVLLSSCLLMSTICVIGVQQADNTLVDMDTQHYTHLAGHLAVHLDSNCTHACTNGGIKKQATKKAIAPHKERKQLLPTLRF